jgi:hypothetical protein
LNDSFIDLIFSLPIINLIHLRDLNLPARFTSSLTAQLKKRPKNLIAAYTGVCTTFVWKRKAKGVVCMSRGRGGLRRWGGCQILQFAAQA